MGISFIVLLRNHFLHTVLLLLSCTAFYSCSEPSSPFGQTEITLTALDASCTEVWLELKFNNLTRPADVAIKKDGSEIARFLSVNKDTIFYIDGLLPSQNYSFEAIIRYEGRDDRTSNSAVVTTMDTTSHEFTWQSWTFGGSATSLLYDVAIMTENNICAVGEIYTLDSFGNIDHNPYNMVHWNGNEWKMKKIFQRHACNPVDYPPIYSIFRFSDSEYVFSAGGLMNWVNGHDTLVECGSRPHIDALLTKLWGSSKDNLYAVGNLGNAVHFNGTNWRKIETGTRLAFQDIYGVYNQQTGKYEVLATAADVFQNHGKEIYKFDNGKAIKIPTNGMTSYFEGLWFSASKKYFVVGPAVHYKENIYSVNDWYKYPMGTISSGYTRAIRGTGLNDIFIVGELGEISHFNGLTWKILVNQPGLSFDTLLKIIVTENLILGVGIEGNKAVIVIGKRTK